MNDESITRVMDSYERIAPHVNEMVAGFYERVFQLTPDARAMFRQDMTVQRQHLAATLALLVRNFRFHDLLEEAVMDLGALHVQIGVRPEQYPIVRQALLESIGRTLGADWNQQLEGDWSELLDHVISVMLKGATLFALKEAGKAG